VRILFSTNLEAWGGGERWMLDAATGLRDRGHDVRLAVAHDAELGRRAEAAGLPVHRLRFRGDLDPANTWRYWRLCRRHRIEVMCLNMDRVLRVGGPGARLAGATVIPRRGSEMPVGAKVSHRFAYLRVARGIIANSEATRRTMLDSAPWLPSGKVRVIYNGVDLDRSPSADARDRLRTGLGTPPDAPVVLMVGELTARKNHRAVVSQLAALRAAHPGLEVWVAGEGPERAALEALASHGGLHLLGFRTDVTDLLAAADVFCHPALREGFGYAVVEAMAAGRPVAVARASNLPEIVDDGRTGLLLDPEDEAAWRTAVHDLLSDPVRARTLAAAGRDEARRRFARDRMLDEVESYFAEVHGRR